MKESPCKGCPLIKNCITEKVYCRAKIRYDIESAFNVVLE